MSSNAPQQQERSQQEQCVLELLAMLSYRSGELSSYLHEIACGVSRLLQSDWSVVTIRAGETGEVVASSVNMGDRKREFSLQGSLAGEIVQTGQPLIIENAQTDARSTKLAEEHGAYLGIPLRTAQGECIGTICSYFHQPRHLSAQSTQLVEILAERAATAIDNYQLYQQQKRYMAELQQANQQLQAEIREREQAEEALRQSEARLRVLVENAADAFLLVDPSTGRVIDANPRACESLGYTYEELLTLSSTDIDARFTVEELARFRHQLTIGVPASLESIHRRKDGTTFPVEARVCLFEAGNQQLELALVRDISDRKQAEQAKARLAEIGELAAMIVHEIRNPLTTVLLGLTAFQQLDLSDNAQQRLMLALEEAERLKRLLNEILLYARGQVLHPSALEMNAFISEMLESIRNIPAAIGRQIEFISTIPTAWILGDRDKLKQVFINLVKNACEAVEEGETITWQIEPGKTAQQIQISIHNHGHPIPPETLVKLGTPFFTTKPTGNGLGLAIVKQIIEAHQGEFTISSEPEIGTVAIVQLPLMHQANIAPDTDPSVLVLSSGEYHPA